MNGSKKKQAPADSKIAKTKHAKNKKREEGTRYRRRRKGFGPASGSNPRFDRPVPQSSPAQDSKLFDRRTPGIRIAVVQRRHKAAAC